MQFELRRNDTMSNYVAVCTLMFVLGISAVPNKFFRVEFDDTNINEDVVIEIIHEGIEKIKEVGLDPYVNEGEDYAITLNYPFPEHLKINGSFKNFKFAGLSNIVINGVSSDGKFLLLDLSLPGIEVVLDNAVTEVSFAGGIYHKIEYSGRLAINNIRFIAQIRRNFFGPTHDDFNLAVDIENVQSNLKLIVGENDLSGPFNEFMELGLPSILMEYKEELNRNLSELILKLIDHRF